MKTRNPRAAAVLSVFLLLLAIGVSGKEAKAAQTEQAEKGNAAVSIEQMGYESWLETLAETVNRTTFAEELSTWRNLYKETSNSMEDSLKKGAAFAAAAVNTAAKKAEADGLRALRDLIQAAKESLETAEEESLITVTEPELVGEGETRPEENEARARYKEAISKLLEKIGSIKELEDAYDPETGYLAVMTYLEKTIEEKQAVYEEAQASEDAAKAEAENANGVYLARKAESDAAFALLKEAVGRAVEASFLVPEGEYYIFNGSGGSTVIDIMDGGMSNGATARLYTYSKTDAQRFAVTHNSDGTVELRCVNSGKVLDAAGRGRTNGTDVRQYASNGTAPQRWVIMDPDSDGLYTIKASYCPLVVSTKDRVNTGGANIQLMSDTGHLSQEWRFAEPAGVYFTDVADPEAWYYEPVYWAFENKITSGYGKDTFKPFANVTRAQAVQFFYNLAGQPDITGLEAVRFEDVPESAWYYKAVVWASATHLTSGYGAGTFRPDVLCTRAMITAFLKKYAGFVGKDTGKQGAVHFTDIRESDWFYEAVGWAANQGLAEGYSNGTFKPMEPCTRGMLVTFLKRACMKWNA